MTEYQNLGLFRRFYRDTNSGNIFQYISDSSLIATRELVAICVGVENNQLSMIKGIAFKNFFVLATRDEVRLAIQKNPQTPKQSVAEQINRATVPLNKIIN